MPWPNVFFPCSSLIAAGKAILSRRRDDFQPNPLRPTDKLWGLNGVTIRSLRRILKRIDAKSSVELAPLFSPLNSKWGPWRMKYYAPLFSSLRHVPLVQEMFTHRIVLTLTALSDVDVRLAWGSCARSGSCGDS
jgi:hypothetical protein